MDVLVYRLVQWCPGQSWDIYGCSSIQAGPVVSWTIQGYLWMFQYIGWSSGVLDNPGISMDVLAYRLVQWCPGQSWDIYGCSSIQAGPVVSWTILGYLWMLQYIGWSSGVLDNPGISMDVLVYRLVQWCPGQSRDIYGCSSIQAGPVVSWTILEYLWMFQYIGWSSGVLDNLGNLRMFQYIGWSSGVLDNPGISMDD